MDYPVRHGYPPKSSRRSRSSRSLRRSSGSHRSRSASLDGRSFQGSRATTDTYGNSTIGSGGSVSLASRSVSSSYRADDGILLSQATSQAMVAAQTIIASGGNDVTALKTARAAAESVLLPERSDNDSIFGGKARHGFLRRRKMKRQSEVIASMALATATTGMVGPVCVPGSIVASDASTAGPSGAPDWDAHSSANGVMSSMASHILEDLSKPSNPTPSVTKVRSSSSFKKPPKQAKLPKQSKRAMMESASLPGKPPRPPPLNAPLSPSNRIIPSMQNIQTLATQTLGKQISGRRMSSNGSTPKTISDTQRMSTKSAAGRDENQAEANRFFNESFGTSSEDSSSSTLSSGSTNDKSSEGDNRQANVDNVLVQFTDVFACNSARKLSAAVDTDSEKMAPRAGVSMKKSSSSFSLSSIEYEDTRAQINQRLAMEKAFATALAQSKKDNAEISKPPLHILAANNDDLVKNKKKMKRLKKLGIGINTIEIDSIKNDFQMMDSPFNGLQMSSSPMSSRQISSKDSMRSMRSKSLVNNKWIKRGFR